MKQYIKSIVEINDNKLSRYFAFFIQALILLSIITFSIETIPNLEPQTRTILQSIEVFSVVVFTIEYFLRIYVADSKPRFVFSFALNSSSSIKSTIRIPMRSSLSI